MTFDQFWRLLEKRNAKLKPENKMTISVESFRASMRQAFDMGEEHGKASRSLYEKTFGGFPLR